MRLSLFYTVCRHKPAYAGAYYTYVIFFHFYSIPPTSEINIFKIAVVKHYYVAK